MTSLFTESPILNAFDPTQVGSKPDEVKTRSAIFDTCIINGVDMNTTVAGLAAHIASSTVHGVTGVVVGTTNAQTLTNKTVTSPGLPAQFGTLTADALTINSPGPYIVLNNTGLGGGSIEFDNNLVATGYVTSTFTGQLQLNSATDSVQLGVVSTGAALRLTNDGSVAMGINPPVLGTPTNLTITGDGQVIILDDPNGAGSAIIHNIGASTTAGIFFANGPTTNMEIRANDIFINNLSGDGLRVDATGHAVLTLAPVVSTTNTNLLTRNTAGGAIETRTLDGLASIGNVAGVLTSFVISGSVDVAYAKFGRFNTLTMTIAVNPSVATIDGNITVPGINLSIDFTLGLTTCAIIMDVDLAVLNLTNDGVGGLNFHLSKALGASFTIGVNHTGRCTFSYVGV